MVDVTGQTCLATHNWNVLLHCLGSGQCIFHTLPGRGYTYASTV